MQSKFSLYFGFFMSALYAVAAFYVIFSKDLYLQNTYRYIFAFILICYGILRGFRGYIKYKQNDSKAD